MEELFKEVPYGVGRFAYDRYSQVIVEVEEADDIHSPEYFGVVLNADNRIDFRNSLLLRILYNEGRWNVLTADEKKLKLANAAIGLILFDLTFRGPFIDKPKLRANCVMAYGSEAYNYYNFATREYEPYLRQAMEMADFVINKKYSSSDFEKIMTAYGDSIILAALYRKNNAFGTFSGFDISYTELSREFAFYPRVKSLILLQEVTTDVVGNMHEMVTTETLEKVLPYVSWYCPLGRSTGYGKYPHAGEELSSISIAYYEDEYKRIASMQVSLIQHAVFGLQKELKSDFSDFTALLLHLEDHWKEIHLLTMSHDKHEKNGWWLLMVDAANRIRIQLPSIDTQNDALKEAAVITTWWTYHSMRSSNMPEGLMYYEVVDFVHYVVSRTKCQCDTTGDDTNYYYVPESSVKDVKCKEMKFDI